MTEDWKERARQEAQRRHNAAQRGRWAEERRLQEEDLRRARERQQRAEQEERERRQEVARKEELKRRAAQDAFRKHTASETQKRYRIALTTLRDTDTWMTLCEGLGLYATTRPHTRRNPNNSSTIVRGETYPSVRTVSVTPGGLRIIITNPSGVGSDRWQTARGDLESALGLTGLQITQHGHLIEILGKSR